MKLYHFCAKHLFERIKKEGLTLGCIPIIEGDNYKIARGFQWLTSNPSFEQEWEKYSTLPYRRNYYRITIKIPKKDKNLLKWIELSKTKALQETAETLNAYGDPENWYVYKGAIKPNYFRKVIAQNSI